MPDGTVIVSYKNRYGTGVVKDGQVRVKELVSVEPRTRPDPDWDTVIEKNRYHLKNLERNAVRTIKKHMNDRPCVNVSFSGGKDSTAALHLARKAGVEKAFFIDTGIELRRRWSSWRRRASRSSGKAATSSRQSRRPVRREGPAGAANS